MRKYTIITGYWAGKNWRGQDGREKADFYKIWEDNTFKYSSPFDVFVIDPNSQEDLLPEKLDRVKWIRFANQGCCLHVHDGDNLNKSYKQKFGGWSLSIMQGMLLAYSNDSDFIYKEQDCLAFNGWVESMYQTLEKKGARMLVGRKQDAAGQALEQSLFIIKHDFILPFLNAYLSLQANDAGEGFLRPEGKFEYLRRLLFEKEMQFLDFGFGRTRPEVDFDFSLPYYVQQLTNEEVKIFAP